MELCKHLHYERSIQPGKAIFYYKTSESDFVPLEIEPKGIRGQKSSYSEGYSRLSKKNIAPQDLAYSNLIRMDSVSVPPLVDGVYCSFSLRILPNSLEPAECDDMEVVELCKQLASTYKRCGGYEVLAERYAKNIVLGEWLDRNRRAYPITIEIQICHGSYLTLEDVHLYDWDSDEPEFTEIVSELSHELTVALTEPRKHWSAKITARIGAEMGEEIFPSQTILGDLGSDSHLSKSFCKTGMPDGREVVVLNMEKVGAGIQKIDDWYQEETDIRLRVHEYGADLDHVISLRRPETYKDFYYLLQKAESHLEEMKALLDGTASELPTDVHYVMAVLIKGGMFQRGKNAT